MKIKNTKIEPFSFKWVQITFSIHFILTLFSFKVDWLVYSPIFSCFKVSVLCRLFLISIKIHSFSCFNWANEESKANSFFYSSKTGWSPPESILPLDNAYLHMLLLCLFCLIAMWLYWILLIRISNFSGFSRQTTITKTFLTNIPWQAWIGYILPDSYLNA